MALNEPVADQQGVLNNAYLTIQPSSGDGYMIMNIWASGEIEIYMFDGLNEVLVESIDTSPYALALYKYLVTNSHYMKIKNVSGGTANIGYSGMQILD